MGTGKLCLQFLVILLLPLRGLHAYHGPKLNPIVYDQSCTESQSSGITNLAPGSNAMQGYKILCRQTVPDYIVDITLHILSEKWQNHAILKAYHNRHNLQVTCSIESQLDFSVHLLDDKSISVHNSVMSSFIIMEELNVLKY